MGLDLIHDIIEEHEMVSRDAGEIVLGYIMTSLMKMESREWDSH